ncbi:unnamed protein product [Colias eurytheme]|nr:unnamed protein product [Colias eurytheme]
MFVRRNPDKYISYVITTLSFYILGSVFYIYGAYKFINILMFPFILLELLRLFVLTFFMITGLLVLKQNTMDLGLLIGISVIVGFTLVGMFYLWVCLANLPILINEMKEDEQIALIEKLQKIIEKSNLRYSTDWTDQPVGDGRFKLQNQKEIFFVSRNKIVDRPPQYNFNTAK